MVEVTKARSDRPSLKQPVANWAAKAKYIDLKHFEMEVTNIFLTRHYNIGNAAKVPIIKELAKEEGLKSYKN